MAGASPRRPPPSLLEQPAPHLGIREDADLERAVDALHGAVFYRLLLSGEPLDATFVEQTAAQILTGLEPRRRITAGVAVGGQRLCSLSTSVVRV